jgi:hypothetical protein
MSDTELLSRSRYAGSFGSLTAFPSPGLDERAFEFGEASENRQHQHPMGCEVSHQPSLSGRNSAPAYFTASPPRFRLILPISSPANPRCGDVRWTAVPSRPPAQIVRANSGRRLLPRAWGPRNSHNSRRFIPCDRQDGLVGPRGWKRSGRTCRAPWRTG